MYFAAEVVIQIWMVHDWLFTSNAISQECCGH